MGSALHENLERGLDIMGAITAARAALPPPGLVKPVLGKAPVPQRAAFVQKATPAGNHIVSLRPTRKPAHGDNKTSIKNARDIGNRAISQGKKIMAAADASAKKMAAAAKAGAAATKVHGATTHIKPHVQAHVVKHAMSAAQVKKLAQAAVDAGNKLIKMADKHQTMVSTHDAKVKASNATVRKKTFIGGGQDLTVMSEILGAALDTMAEEITIGDAQADYTQGYTDGWNGAPKTLYTVDYTQGYTDGQTDAANGGVVPASTGDGTYTDPNDPTGEVAALGPAPTMASVQADQVAQAEQDPETTTGVLTDVSEYTSDPVQGGLPVGAVLYDGSHDFHNMDIGSLNYFGDIPGGGAPKKNGFVLNQGGWWGGGAHHGSGWMAVRGSSMDTVDDKEARDLSNNNRDPVQLAATSKRYGWGPLIGNPKSWTKGLRFDPYGKQWFWFRNQAPSWATQGTDQLALNQAMLDYNAQLTAAKADNAASMAQDALDTQTANQTAKQNTVDDAAQQREYEQEQAAAQQQANLQALQDQSTLTTQSAQQQAIDDSNARQMQAQMQAQAQYEAQSAQTQFNIAQQAAQAGLPMQSGLFAQPGGYGGGYGGGYADGGGAYDPNAGAYGQPGGYMPGYGDGGDPGVDDGGVTFDAQGMPVMPVDDGSDADMSDADLALPGDQGFDQGGLDNQSAAALLDQDVMGARGSSRLAARRNRHA